MKVLMSGNEAIALGGGHFKEGLHLLPVAREPPSTEIMESFAKYDVVYAEWAPNEKVGMEVAIGAALTNTNSLASMKHVGVNVATDSLFTVSYTGING